MPTPTTTLGTADTVAEFFTRFAGGDRPGMVELFAPDAEVCVPGAPSVPWTGTRTDPAAVDEFLRICLEDVDTERFDMTRTIVDGEDAVVFGAFAHRINSTGKLFASAFVLHLRVVGGAITRYTMYEDSHGAALAWQE